MSNNRPQAGAPAAPQRPRPHGEEPVGSWWGQGATSTEETQDADQSDAATKSNGRPAAPPEKESAASKQQPGAAEQSQEAPKQAPAEPAKPDESKPAPAKQSKPSEAKSKQAGSKPAPSKSAEPKPAESQPAPAKQSESKSAPAKSADSKPASGEAKSAPAKSADSKPAQSKAAESEPAQQKPAKSQSQPQPAESTESQQAAAPKAKKSAPRGKVQTAGAVAQQADERQAAADSSGQQDVTTTMPVTKEKPAPSESTVDNVRKARLRMVRVDPWSVMKLAFALSIALAIVTVVAVTIVWAVLGAAGVWDAINSSVATVLSDNAAAFDITDYVGFGRIIGLTLIIAAVDIVLFTAIATVGAFMYNLAASLLGGLEVTLAEDR